VKDLPKPHPRQVVAMALPILRNDLPDPVFPGRPLLRSRTGRCATSRRRRGRQRHHGDHRAHPDAGRRTIALVSHAAGRKDQAEANLIFNQSVLMSAILGIVTLVAGYALTSSYVHSLAANEAAATAGISYLYWYLPGLALQFAMVAMGSACAAPESSSQPWSCRCSPWC